jgi:hypothetical protein
MAAGMVDGSGALPQLDRRGRRGDSLGLRDRSPVERLGV